LVTLKRDADVPFSLEAARVRPLQLPRLLRLFHELGFNRYQREVRRLVEEMDWPVDEESDNGAAGEAAEKETGPEAERGEYELVCTEEELDELVQTLRRQKRIAVDTETTGLERDAELCGICLAWKPGHGVYVPIRSPE